MPTIAFVTYQQLPELTLDEQSVAACLRRRGLEVDAVSWDDPTALWSDYAAIVVRSCWDYHHHSAEFAGWIDQLEYVRVPLWNPAPLLRWNMDKRYLYDLEQRGVSIVPTALLEQGANVDLAELMDQRGWQDVVVKPAISATAYGTWRTSQPDTKDQARLNQLLGVSGVLVQPFQADICLEGEWSLVFIGGAYSHAVLKRPRVGDFRVQSSFGGRVEDRSPPSAVIKQAEQVVAQIQGPWLYARVDGVVIDGVLRLMELELIEPFLFLEHASHAVERFTDALVVMV